MAHRDAPPTGASVNIIVGTKSQSETQTGDLHISGRDTVEASTPLDAAAIEVRMRIVNGHLPPPRSLL
jgi:hypothetical protein